MTRTLDTNNKRRHVAIGPRRKNQKKNRLIGLHASAIQNKSYATPPRNGNTTTESCVLTPIGINSNKNISNEAIEKAILDMLNGVCDSDDERKREILSSVTARLAPVVPNVLISMETSPATQWNPKAFLLNRSPTAARSQKSRVAQRYKKAMKEATDVAGDTQEQKLLVMHEYFEKNKENPLIGGLISSFSNNELPLGTVSNIKELLHVSNNRANSNDAISFRATMLSSLVSTKPTKKKDVMMLAKFFDTPLKKFRSKFKEAMKARRDLMKDPSKQPLVKPFKRRSRSIITAELIAELYEWLISKCEEVKASPRTNHTVLVKNPYTGVKEKQQKHFYMNSVREIHNQLIRPVKEGGFGRARDSEGKVVVSDTMLRSLLPANLSRLTESHKELCGCENCIVSKGYCQTVKGFETRLSKQLPTAEAVAFKASMHKYSHPREAAATIACAPKQGIVQGPWPLHKFSCAMGECKDCKDKVVPTHPKLLDRSAVAKEIAFHEYKPWSFCSIHKTLPGAPTKCPQCKELKEQNAAYKVGKLHRKSVLPCCVLVLFLSL